MRRMSDVFSAKKRSYVMSRIRGRGNRDTELRMIKIFRATQITGWRRGSMLFGRPDFVFPNIRVAVFVDGCFWHCCREPGHSKLPRNNAAFWQQKLQSNVKRDRLVTRTLRKEGWAVVRVWEHDLRHATRCVRRIKKALENQGCRNRNFK